MGGCRCSFRNCPNTTKTRDNLHFFHYPVKHKERCRQWIEHAKKPQFYDLDEEQLRNKVICESHFEDHLFPNLQKKRLLHTAIPTLNGDCIEEDAPRTNFVKIQDVQVLPANDDGTIFVLETNPIASGFQQSKRIESYIYTNNGLMLPINKCNDEMGNDAELVYSNDIEHTKYRPEIIPSVETSCDSMITDPESNPHRMQFRRRIHPKMNPHLVKPQEVQVLPEDVKQEDKYVHQKIKQHSKDIALLKRMLRNKTSCRKPSNNAIISTLKKRVPSSLLSAVSFNLNKCELSADDLEFYTTIYTKSPELYHVLANKYRWKMPNPEILAESNGHNLPG